MKLKINIPYNRPIPKTEKDKAEFLTESELTLNYIEFASMSAYPNGIPSGGERRIFGRIQRKIDQAIIDKKDEIEMETAEMDLLKTCFEKAAFPGNISKYVVLLEDEINKKDPKEEATPAK